MSEYTFDENGKLVLSNTNTPGEETLYHDKIGEGHNMGYDEYKVRKKLAIDATRRADNEDTVAKSKAEVAAFVKAENARIAYDKDYQEGLERFETSQVSQDLRNKYLEFLADKQAKNNKQKTRSLEVTTEELVPVNPYITDTSANAANTLNSESSQYQRNLLEGKARYKAMMDKLKTKSTTKTLPKFKKSTGNINTKNAADIDESLNLPGMQKVTNSGDLTTSGGGIDLDEIYYNPMNHLGFPKKEAANKLATTHDFKVPFPGAETLDLTVDPDSVSLDDFTWKTPLRFKVGVGNVNKKKNPALVFPTFIPSGVDSQNSSVDTSGSLNFDFSAEDALSAAVGFSTNPVAQAFSTMKTLKGLGDIDYEDLINKYIK